MDTIYQLLTSWLFCTYFNVTLWRYILAVTVLIASVFVKRAFELYIIKWITRIISRSPLRHNTKIVESLGKPASAFVLIGGLYLAAMILGSGGMLPTFMLLFLNRTYAVAIGVIVLWAAYRLMDILSTYIEDYVAPRHDAFDKQFVPLIRKSLRVFIIMLGVPIILQSSGVNVTSLIAGLSIGGVAVSLAAQDSLGNFFGSVALLADKPFKVGDWIIVSGKFNGFVESIGFRSTTIRSWAKTLVTVPNKMLAGEVIDNWSRMYKRRVSQMIGVTYETPPEQMDQLVKDIETLLKEDPGVHQEYILVRFTEFGSSSLDIMVYYFTKSIEWAEHLAVRQRCNLKIMQAVKGVGSSIAYPTRTLYLEGQQLSSDN